MTDMIQLLDRGGINEDRIRNSLNDAIDAELHDSGSLATRPSTTTKSTQLHPLYIIPVYNIDDDASNDIHDDNFTFRPLVPTFAGRPDPTSN